MRRFLHRCLTRTPVIGLLMAALLFRALIPAGFMPAQGESGAIVMQLCSGFGGKTVLVELEDDGASTNPGGQLFDHSPCGFAAASMSAPPLASAAVALSIGPDFHSAVEGISSVIAPSIARAQSPRAPPLI
jgi:hypothetical protein